MTMKNKKTEDAMDQFEFLLSQEELQCLEEVAYLEPFLDGILGKAKRRRKEGPFKTRFPADELRDSADALLYASGYVTPPEKAAAFEALGRKLEAPLPKRLRFNELRTELHEPVAGQKQSKK
jgi:hypothetical protein